MTKQQQKQIDKLYEEEQSLLNGKRKKIQKERKNFLIDLVKIDFKD